MVDDTVLNIATVIVDIGVIVIDVVIIFSVMSICVINIPTTVFLPC